MQKIITKIKLSAKNIYICSMAELEVYNNKKITPIELIYFILILFSMDFHK
jgi:hypothetical protein